MRWSPDGQYSHKSADGRHRITQYATGDTLTFRALTDGEPVGIVRDVADTDDGRRAAIRELRRACNA